MEPGRAPWEYTCIGIPNHHRRTAPCPSTRPVRPQRLRRVPALPVLGVPTVRPRGTSAPQAPRRLLNARRRSTYRWSRGRSSRFRSRSPQRTSSSRRWASGALFALRRCRSLIGYATIAGSTRSRSSTQSRRAGVSSSTGTGRPARQKRSCNRIVDDLLRQRDSGPERKGWPRFSSTP